MFDNVRNYVFLRGLELEGRWPHDVGAWPITVRRIEMGWGLPMPEHCPEILLEQDHEYPPTPQIDPRFLKPNRIDFYCRVRDHRQCRWVIQDGIIQSAGLEIFPQWGVANRGMIDDQSYTTMPTESHLVRFVGCDNTHRLFKFINTWGETWGDSGYGYLSYDYFNRWVIDSWDEGIGPSRIGGIGTGVNINSPRHNRQSRLGIAIDTSEVLSRDHDRAIVIEAYDHAADERIGWATLLVMPDWLDIEELYVKPEYRGHSFGSRIADQIRTVSRYIQKPLRLWVPYADCAAESPDNRDRLISITHRMGLRFSRSQVHWAAYLAVRDGESNEPVEPARIPKRPKSALPQLLAVAIGLSQLLEGDKHPPVSDVVMQSIADRRLSFSDAARYVVEKNAELYRRLAK